MNKNQHFSNQIHEDDELTSQVIPVIEEYLKVGKREVETGKLLIRKKIRDKDELISIPLFHDEFSVEHVKMEKQVQGTPPELRFEGNTIIIPVLREEVVIEKRLVLVEEVRITKNKIQHNYEQQVTLQKEEVIIEHK